MCSTFPRHNLYGLSSERGPKSFDSCTFMEVYIQRSVFHKTVDIATSVDC